MTQHAHLPKIPSIRHRLPEYLCLLLIEAVYYSSYEHFLLFHTLVVTKEQRELGLSNTFFK